MAPRTVDPGLWYHGRHVRQAPPRPRAPACRRRSDRLQSTVRPRAPWPRPLPLAKRFTMSSPIRLWNGLGPGTLGGLLLLGLISHAVEAQPGSSPLDAT